MRPINATPLTATAAVVGPGNSGELLGVILIGGSDAATLRVYEGTAATASKMKAAVNAAIATQSVWESPTRPDGGVRFSDGLYAVLTGTGVLAIVYWR